MKLLCDARWKGTHGIGRFATEVMKRLPQRVELESGPKPLSLADPLWLSYQVITKRPDVFFSPGFNPPPICPVPLVFSIHDLMQITQSGVTTPAKRLYYEMVIRPAARRAYRVLTVSEFSRTQILLWSGLPEERVVNVGNGVDPIFCPDGRSFSTGYPYVLYVGNHRSHKNLNRLFDAFRRVDPPELRLVLTGRPSDEMSLRVARAGLSSRIEFLGTLSDATLAAVYRGASLLVLPSLSEGFGLPALEAMACGVPVVASSTPALVEIMGGAGLLVDPHLSCSIRNGIEAVLGDAVLRASMRQAGLRRAKCFSWDRVGASVRGILEQASGSIG